MNRPLFAAVLVACSSVTALALARDVTFDQLPPAVQATVSRETQGGTIMEIELDDGQGVVTYEVEYSAAGAKYELDIAADGKLLRRQPD